MYLSAEVTNTGSSSCSHEHHVSSGFSAAEWGQVSITSIARRLQTGCKSCQLLAHTTETSPQCLWRYTMHDRVTHQRGSNPVLGISQQRCPHQFCPPANAPCPDPESCPPANKHGKGFAPLQQVTVCNCRSATAMVNAASGTWCQPTHK